MRREETASEMISVGNVQMNQFQNPQTQITNHDLRVLKEKVRAPFVGPKSKKFPSGIKVFC